MGIEIERKFLVANDKWRRRYTRKQKLRDGLIASTAESKVRVRLYENKATLTVKSKAVGGVRAEFEYEIPVADANELLENHCMNMILEKTRFYVLHEGFEWEVDVYEGVLAGMVLAEVELTRSDVEVPLPDWIGREVTGDPEYKKINMLRTRMEAASVV